MLGLWMPELVLYGVRELALNSSRPMRVMHRGSSTNESGEHCLNSGIEDGRAGQADQPWRYK